MIPLEQVHVASPCHADWDEMTGTAQARFCGQCRKNVYNLSEMTRAQAEALISEKEGHLCVRFYTRADGTVLTQDCPVGLRAVRVKLARKLSYAVAVLLSCGTGLLRWTGTAQAVTPVHPQATVIKPPMPGTTALGGPDSKVTMGAPPALLPRHTLGKFARPRSKPLNPSVGPDPFRIPGAGPGTANGVTPPPPAMTGYTTGMMGVPVTLSPPPADRSAG